MQCVKCNANVKIVRNEDLTYKITNSDNCKSTSENNRDIGSSFEEATFMKDKVAVVHYTVEPLLRIYAMYKNSPNYWESYNNFEETIATNLEIPWGKNILTGILSGFVV